MKKMICALLSVAMILTGCSNSTSNVTEFQEPDDNGMWSPKALKATIRIQGYLGKDRQNIYLSWDKDWVVISVADTDNGKILYVDTDGDLEQDTDAVIIEDPNHTNSFLRYF